MFEDNDLDPDIVNYINLQSRYYKIYKDHNIPIPWKEIRITLDVIKYRQRNYRGKLYDSNYNLLEICKYTKSDYYFIIDEVLYKNLPRNPPLISTINTPNK